MTKGLASRALFLLLAQRRQFGLQHQHGTVQRAAHGPLPMRHGDQRPDGGVVVPDVPDVSLPVVPDVPDGGVVVVPVAPVVPPVVPVVPVVPVAPVPVVSLVVPVPVVPVVPLVPELVLGAVADVSPVPVVVVGSVFLQAARLAISAAANRIFDALLRAFICFTPRSRLSFTAVSR
jgi:hypothetical protein